jgi:hypothetical protein
MPGGEAINEVFEFYGANLKRFVTEFTEKIKCHDGCRSLAFYAALGVFARTLLQLEGLIQKSKGW